jgi:uncharacterized RDD family membrane protein YckC
LEEVSELKYAGFWIRFVAFIVDAVVVSIIVFPFALAVALVSPNSILVEVPFGLFTTTETIREEPETTKEHSDGSTSIVQASIVKEEVLGLWSNYYKVQETRSKGETESSKSLIDPDNEYVIHKTTSSDIEFYVIFLYWIILEGSIWQASIGKRIMGIKVITSDGGRPSIFQAAARNLLKILSGIIIFIGFMMAGWTSKKQALHDMIPSMLVVKERT